MPIERRGGMRALSANPGCIQHSIGNSGISMKLVCNNTSRLDLKTARDRIVRSTQTSFIYIASQSTHSNRELGG